MICILGLSTRNHCIKRIRNFVTRIQIITWDHLYNQTTGKYAWIGLLIKQIIILLQVNAMSLSSLFCLNYSVMFGDERDNNMKQD